ncbi:MAG: TlpA family protein disulfide reductase [Deferrisomatales bacterium]
MTTLPTWLLLAALSLAAVPTPAAAAPAPATPVATDGAVRVGDPAPDFSLQALSGEAVNLADSLGKAPVLVVFWSYFCFPCQKELPELEALHRELGPDRLRLVGVNLDGPQFDGRILPFLSEKGITFPNAYDKETEEFFELASRYGVVGSPTSFLVDLQGRVRFIHLGRLDPQVLKGVLGGIRDQAFCPEITKPTPAPRR